MPVPFSRTQRALADDHFYLTIFLTPLVTVLISGILYWGLYAQIAIYATSASATVRTPQVINAQFSPSLLETITTNQPALFYQTGVAATDDQEPIALRIVQINNTLRDGLVEVRLQVVEEHDTALPLRRGLEGVVEIRTRYQTPVQLLLQTFTRRAVVE